MRNLFLLIIALMMLVLGGCTSSGKIQKCFTERPHHLYYLHDSKVVPDKLPVNVSVSVSDQQIQIPEYTEIKRTKGWVIPLLVFNMWKSENECTLGSDMLDQNLGSAVCHSLCREIERSGNFLADTLREADYHLEVQLNRIESSGPYSSSGFFYFLLFFYGFGYSDIAGPAISDVEISYELRKGGVTVLENTLSAQIITDPINLRVSNNTQLIRHYATSMTECIAHNLKQINEDLVGELNTYFGYNLSGQLN